MCIRESRPPLASAPQHVLQKAISALSSVFARYDYGRTRSKRSTEQLLQRTCCFKPGVEKFSVLRLSTIHSRAFSQLTVCAYFAYLRLSVLLLVQSFKPAYAKSEPIELTPAHIALVRANLDLVACGLRPECKLQEPAAV
jgi:hypothetical protein